MIEQQEDPLVLINDAPDPISSPDLFKACSEGLEVIAELSGFTEAEAAQQLSRSATRLKNQNEQEITTPDLIISRLALLPTTCALGGTRKSLTEMNQSVQRVISQISLNQRNRP